MDWRQQLPKDLSFQLNGYLLWNNGWWLRPPDEIVSWSVSNGLPGHPDYYYLNGTRDVGLVIRAYVGVITLYLESPTGRDCGRHGLYYERRKFAYYAD